MLFENQDREEAFFDHSYCRRKERDQFQSEVHLSEDMLWVERQQQKSNIVNSLLTKIQQDVQQR
jgi:hypothetical protein